MSREFEKLSVLPERIGRTLMGERKRLGKISEKVIIPVPPLVTEMDAPYFELRDSIVNRIKTMRLRFIIQANAGMIELYWNIGNNILRRQEAEGRGAKVIDRLSVDLKEEFPDMCGLSPRNLKYMRQFAENWPDSSIMQQPVAQLQWRSILTLLFEKFLLELGQGFALVGRQAHMEVSGDDFYIDILFYQ